MTTITQAAEEALGPTVALAKRQILADVKAGRVPSTVASFSELHDYVDANEYGGLTSNPPWVRDGWLDEAFMEWANVAQDRVDEWIKAGGIADLTFTASDDEDEREIGTGWVEEGQAFYGLYPIEQIVADVNTSLDLPHRDLPGVEVRQVGLTWTVTGPFTTQEGMLTSEVNAFLTGMACALTAAGKRDQS